MHPVQGTLLTCSVHFPPRPCHRSPSASYHQTPPRNCPHQPRTRTFSVASLAASSPARFLRLVRAATVRLRIACVGIRGLLGWSVCDTLHGPAQASSSWHEAQSPRSV